MMQKRIDLRTRPWQQITAGFVDMPKTKNAHGKETMDQVLVVVDRFSKQVILAPIRNNFMTKEVIVIFWKRIFAVFGIPETIISDRDKIFKSEEWRKLSKGIGIMQILSIANHQQTDGQSERKIQEMQSYLRNYNYLDYDKKRKRHSQKG